MVETGISWWDGVYTRLPGGARFEIEMQWGSIGWCVPAAFGYSLGLETDRRLVAAIGDGSFQLTAQEVSNMIRHGQEILIFLINNRGYVIESAIHDGPYNYYKNWDYAGLIDVFNADDGHGLGLTARTPADLAEAIGNAHAHKGGPVLIECQIPNDDASPQVISWGSKVARVNARPHQQHLGEAAMTDQVIGAHNDLHSEHGALKGEHPGRSANPIIKVQDVIWLEFEKPDLDQGRAFAQAVWFIHRAAHDEQWGSIGWAVPAAFGYSVGLEADRRLVAAIGDGSFQLTAQEVSNMIRHRQEILIFLVNNRGYVIESAIHDGPYNYYKNWDYAGLIDVFNAEDGHGLGLTATTPAELADAIATGPRPHGRPGPHRMSSPQRGREP
jgi:TPP-dependent 2-oxoacid decarboxylase